MNQAYPLPHLLPHPLRLALVFVGRSDSCWGYLEPKASATGFLLNFRRAKPVGHQPHRMNNWQHVATYSKRNHESNASVGGCLRFSSMEGPMNNDNPYSASKDNHDSTHGKSKSHLPALILSGIIIFLLIGLVLPGLRPNREAARRMSCGNNLKQIALALLNYEAEYGGLPPAYTVSPEGKRLHSWRALILPFIEQSELYSSIDFSKPWDDPANAFAYTSCPTIYGCTSNDYPKDHTNYLALVGTDRCFLPTESRKLEDITDGAPNTLMVVEVAAAQTVHWMCPQDIEEPLNIFFGPKTSLPHAGGRQSVRIDGGASFLSSQIDSHSLLALETIAGNEHLSQD